MFFKKNGTPLTRGRALRTLTVAFAQRSNDLLCTQCIPEHIIFGQYTYPIMFDNGIVTPTISVELATHRNCYQLFHNCLQRTTGSCRGGGILYD